MPRGRPPLSRGTKNRKKEFDERLSAYSLSALDNVIDIADKAYNTETRLKANIFLLDKALGKSYALNGEEKHNNELNELTVNIVTVGKEHGLTQKEEQDIYKAEQGIEFTNPDDFEEWKTDDSDWGNDVYDAD